MCIGSSTIISLFLHVYASLHKVQEQYYSSWKQSHPSFTLFVWLVLPPTPTPNVLMPPTFALQNVFTVERVTVHRLSLSMDGNWLQSFARAVVVSKALIQIELCHGRCFHFLKSIVYPVNVIIMVIKKKWIHIYFCAHFPILRDIKEFFFFYITVLSHWDFFHGKSRLLSPGKASCGSRATQPRVHAGCFSVSIIHQTMTWTTGSLALAQMLMRAVAHVGCGHCKRVCAGSWLSEKNSLAALGNRTCLSDTLVQHYQLSYIPTQSTCKSNKSDED